MASPAQSRRATGRPMSVSLLVLRIPGTVPFGVGMTFNDEASSHPSPPDRFRSAQLTVPCNTSDRPFRDSPGRHVRGHRPRGHRCRTPARPGRAVRAAATAAGDRRSHPPRRAFTAEQPGQPRADSMAAHASRRMSAARLHFTGTGPHRGGKRFLQVRIGLLRAGWQGAGHARNPPGPGRRDDTPTMGPPRVRIEDVTARRSTGSASPSDPEHGPLASGTRPRPEFVGPVGPMRAGPKFRGSAARPGPPPGP